MWECAQKCLTGSVRGDKAFHEHWNNDKDNKELLKDPRAEHCEARTSTSALHDPAEDGIISHVREKIERLTRVKRSSGFYERLQTARYEPGQFYSAHYDSGVCGGASVSWI